MTSNDRRVARAGELAATSTDRSHLTPKRNGTDLPVPRCGTCGSSTGGVGVDADELLELLDLARRLVPTPPLDDSTALAADRWVRDVAERLDLRRHLLYIVSDARRVIREEQRTRRMLDRETRGVRSLQRQQADRAAGTYWAHRERGRRSRQPVRIEVDPTAWEAFRRHATRGGVAVGEAVGRLIEAAGPGRLEGAPRNFPPEARPRRVVFLRVAVEADAWQSLIDRRPSGVSRQRLLGVLVERDVSSRAGAARLPRH